jgi:hypothetical protein
VVISNWYRVRDANGFSHLIRAADMDAAKARQEELQREEPLTEREVAQLKRVLHANWVWYEE